MSWDLVVLTASDHAQKVAFERQLKEFVPAEQLDQTLFRVFRDWPPGVKTGGGGATLIALHELKQEFGEKLFNYKILMIHAGGYSQRQPSASIMGKIFAALPGNFNAGPFTMLNLKLKLYEQIAAQMSPGIFLAASDALEAFGMHHGDSGWHFDKDDFVVLAHPSSVQIAVNHGVFILDSEHLAENRTKSCMVPMRRVLQKPTVEAMRELGALHPQPGSTDAQQFAYTDSAYYMSASVARSFINFYEQNQPLSCELDCYGDFMRPLGSEATRDYFLDTSTTVSADSKALAQMRSKLYDLLHDFSVSALVLPKSKFYHIGTMRELLFHLCEDVEFENYFNLTKRSFSDLQGETTGLHGCVMSSSLASQSESAKTSIIEFCHFTEPMRLAGNSILSNCFYDQKFALSMPCYMSTVPLRIDSKIQYVTVVFGTGDNLKRDGSVENLCYCGTKLNKALELWSVNLETTRNLWSARIFPGSDSMEESFDKALKMIESLEKKQTYPLANSQLYSMVDILQQKDIDCILNYRHGLIRSIKSKTTE